MRLNERHIRKRMIFIRVYSSSFNYLLNCLDFILISFCNVLSTFGFYGLLELESKESIAAFS